MAFRRTLTSADRAPHAFSPIFEKGPGEFQNGMNKRECGRGRKH